jgi:hypothetical protein
VRRLPVAYHDAAIEVSLKLEGAKQIALSIDNSGANISFVDRLDALTLRKIRNKSSEREFVEIEEVLQGGIRTSIRRSIALSKTFRISSKRGRIQSARRTST